MIELILLLLAIIMGILYYRWKIKQINKKKIARQVDIGLGYLRAAYKNRRL